MKRASRFPWGCNTPFLLVRLPCTSPHHSSCEHIDLLKSMNHANRHLRFSYRAFASSLRGRRVGSPNIRMARVYNHIVVILGEMPRRVLWGKDLLPNDGADEILLSKHFITQLAQILHLTIINTDEDDPILSQQIPAPDIAADTSCSATLSGIARLSRC